MQYIIEVTQQDIDTANSYRFSVGGICAGHCPIAYALRRRFPLADDFYAHPDFCRVTTGNLWGTVWTVESTETMRRFMKRWDRTCQAKPHRFRTTSR